MVVEIQILVDLMDNGICEGLSYQRGCHQSQFDTLVDDDAVANLSIGDVESTALHSIINVP